MNFLKLSAAFTALVIMGCTSVSSMQTARTVAEGEYRFLVASGLFRTDALSTSDPDQVLYPYLELGTRFGFTPGWDLGFKVTAPGTLTGDVKACLYADDAFAAALGVGVAYLAVKDRSAGDDFFNEDVLDILLPAYLSYDFSKEFGVYLSPRVVVRHFKQGYLLAGGALGTRIGNSWGVMLEASAAFDTKSSFKQYQLGAGLFFGSPHAAVANP